MTVETFPEVIENEAQLNSLLSQPKEELVAFMRELKGDIMILGIAGKMGISLGELVLNAIKQAGVEKTVYGVARFSDAASREQLEKIGVKTLKCDLLDRASVASLPQVDNIIFMAGRKFGTAGAQSLTWAMNTLVPANVGEHFKKSNIVAFSTGCVYPLVEKDNSPTEKVEPAPIGGYAQSCLGRERAFEYYSQSFDVPVCLYRLNYSVDLRYGVLFDIAEKIWKGEPVNNGVGYFNIIWQGDANHQALMCLGQCESPANIMNVTGPEILNTETVAKTISEIMGKPVIFATKANDLSYLNNNAKAAELFGQPSVSAQQLIRWQAHWIMNDGRSLGKPTHFEVNNGNY